MPDTRAVLFDLYYTLIHHYPSREDIQVEICGQFGLDVTPQTVRRALPAADDFYYRENTRSPIGKRNQEEKMAVYAQYQNVLLKAMGIEAPPEVVREILTRLRAVEMKLVLFDDVVPTLEELDSRGFTRGLISNIDRDIQPLCDELGLSRYLDFWVTAQEVGVDKPQPLIYEAALNRAGADADQALYIADRYQDDVTGALEVGIRALLLDRYDLFSEITTCPRIRSLTQVSEYI